MPRADNPAWRAYALMVWPQLQTFGNSKPLLDDDGKPVLDENGKPKTEWVGFTIPDMTERTIRVADALYNAEIDADGRWEEKLDKVIAEKVAEEIAGD